MDFSKNIFENRKEKGAPLIVAHRGVCGANIPCNSLAAYKIAVDQGADVVEIDVAITKDKKYYVFHPGTEHIFLGIDRRISDMSADEVEELRLLNQDKTPTSYKVPALSQVLALLKGKAYVNVDKFWTDIEGISAEIRKAGVEDQVIVKTGTDEKTLDEVKKYASDFMFIPIIRRDEGLTERLIKDGVNVIGAEVLFESEDAEVISDAYIEDMHKRGLMVWVNSIIYDERAVLSAGHTDDAALTVSPDLGWGWIIDKGVDMIQTDWTLSLKNYIDSRK
jgi:glycerophosphoryl diester phosphodiesterase